MRQLESGFTRTINWNKYQSKLTEKEQDRFFNYLIDLSFQGANRLSLKIGLIEQYIQGIIFQKWK